VTKEQGDIVIGLLVFIAVMLAAVYGKIRA
jgi:hypothetical protein